MNKKSFVLVCLTLLFFLISLLVIPQNIVSHINRFAVPTAFSNKYIMFLMFAAIDVVGSIFWNNMINKLQTMKLLPIIQEKLAIYFSFLMLVLLLTLMVSTISPLLATCLLIGGHIVYILYLIFNKQKYSVK